ncbi:MAG: GNAT family N-acetyltransferase [Sporichthyaceae bacterium]
MGIALPPSSPELVGDGVRLGPWEERDLPGVVALADDDASRTFSASLADVRTIDDARRWVAGRSGPDRVDWAVRDPATGDLIGRSALHRFAKHPQAAEIGYGVHPAHRGRGVATAAVAAVTRFAFGDLGLCRVELVHDQDNTASCVVADRSGYLLEGVEREALGYPDGRVSDLHRHARLATDPAGPSEPSPRPLVVPDLQGAGVRLRPWLDADAPTYRCGMTDPESARWSGAAQPFTHDDARRTLARFRRRAAAGLSVVWAIEVDGIVTGSLGVRSINRVDQHASVAYWVLPEHRGHGIAPRALRLATTYAVDVLGLHRVQLQHAVANTASCRVAEKADFALESTQRGSCLLAEGFVDEHQHVRVRTA